MEMNNDIFTPDPHIPEPVDSEDIPISAPAKDETPAETPPPRRRRKADAPVLTIESGDEIETEDAREAAAWHEIHNAYRTRRILSAPLGGIEQTDSGKTIAVVDYNGFRIVIPLKEMMVAPSAASSTDSMAVRQMKLLGNMLGAEIDFVILGIDSKSRSVVASRREAMMRKRQLFYFSPDANGEYRVREGRVVQARVIAVADKSIRVEIFGVECSIMARDLAWDWIGDLLFILLTMCFFTSFLNMVTIAMQSMELGSGLDNVKKIMDMETMKSGQQTLSKTGCYGIDFDNVTFNYTQGGKDALSDVDIHLEPGSLNAFVGPSGAGKTTAVQLLGRYWDVSSGTIKIGGVPVTELQTENLSDLTAFVFQDVFLLEDTLLENIRMGTDATEEQVRQAAKAAQIDDFIMSLPKGYATRIGDEGVKLSGGQQQRISIARAILKDAPIVVFDEATSYSDIENEHKIQLALQNLLRGKTTIMIAHRLHTIRNADKIVVFQDGKVVEQGTHDELIASGSTYSHMWDTYTRETIGEE